MMEGTVFLFPGQGAQFPGMALDLLESGGQRIKSLFSLASDIAGYDMAAFLAKAGAEELKKTDVSQPLITLANLAAAAYASEKGIRPLSCAGFSLGEYAALACAGIISEEECFFLVTRRGLAMQAAINRIAQNGSSPGMAAVIGLDPSKVESLIAEWKSHGLLDLYAANINSPKQVAVSGSAEALEEAEKCFKEAGAKRFLRLQVAGPFHSIFMREAAEAFAPELEKVKFSDPVIPIFSNVTGKQIKNGTEAKALALRQITESVRWTDIEAAIAELEPKVLLETGPGKVLQGLWKDTGSVIPCLSAGIAAQIDELMKAEGV